MLLEMTQFDAIAKEILENKGISINPFHGVNSFFRRPMSRYMVSEPHTEVQVSNDVFSVNDVIDFIYTNITKLRADKDLYFGAWVSDGIVYLDLSKNYDSYFEAVIKGFQAKQLAIWDLQEFEEITLDSSLLKEKAS